VIRRLLVGDAVDSGAVVAVTAADGILLLGGGRFGSPVEGRTDELRAGRGLGPRHLAGLNLNLG
jgi:hypothetical protein